MFNTLALLSGTVCMGIRGEKTSFISGAEACSQTPHMYMYLYTHSKS